MRKPVRKTLSGFAAAVACLSVAATPACARTITWSGYTWDVRNEGLSAPGPNVWSDSEANVAVDGGDLVLSIARDASGGWASAEVDNTSHLGYGTYRWVVATDLGTLDPADVLGLFTYADAPPSNNEIDIEASRWNIPQGLDGSATVWQDAGAGRRNSAPFRYTGRPPYTEQFTWAPGSITSTVTDAAGTVLLDWRTTSAVPVPSVEVARINYWRCCGAPDLPGPHSVRLRSFAWSPLTVADAAPPRVTLRMARRAVRVPGGTTIDFTATRTVRVQFGVQRRVGRRWAPVGAFARTVRAGRGRLRFGGFVAGRPLRPGGYRMLATMPGASRPAARLAFTVRR
jgi:hypothetical protein